MYEELLNEAANCGLLVKEKPLRGYDGRIKGKRIAIKRDMPTIKKACVLSEELGHHYTSFGNILDQSKLENRKQEKRARNWAYKRMIPLDKFIEAYQAGVTSRYEFAELIGVTEDFLTESIKHYQQKYGLCTTHNGYIIYFENVVVVKLFEWLYIVLHYIFFNSKSNIRSKMREKHEQHNDIERFYRVHERKPNRLSAFLWKGTGISKRLMKALRKLNLGRNKNDKNFYWSK